MNDSVLKENEGNGRDFELIQELEELTPAGSFAEDAWSQAEASEEANENEWEQERRPLVRRPANARSRAGSAPSRVRPARPRPSRPRAPSPRPGSRVAPRFGVRSQPFGARVCHCPSPCPEHGTESARWLQASLNQVMRLQLPVTGRIDTTTRDAIRSFQQERGLPVDGIAGPEVERALIEARAGTATGADGAAGTETPSDAPAEQEFELAFDAEIDVEGEAEAEVEISRTTREYIRWVQRALNRIANARLDEDGMMGPLTRAAVQTFQRSKGLAADGIVGPITEAALVRAGAGSPPTAAPSPAPPTTTVPVETPLPAEGPGYYSYTSADKRYAIAPTISAIQSIARAWQQSHPSGPRLGIGNISKRGGGTFPPHSTHREGLNVDIRPVRSDRSESAVQYTHASYSRSLTQQLADLIHSNPVLKVSSILFNDPSVRGVKPYKGHDDHLHVTFLKPSDVGMPAPAPSTGSNIRDRIVEIALGERERWRNGALEEWDDAARNILIDYWQTGLSMPPADAIRFADNLYHWSAAFICWVLRRAGVSASRFSFNSFHSTYIAAAYQKQQQQASGVKAYSTTQSAPRLGDLVCTTYADQNGNRPPAELSQVRANTSGYHCDIVVAAGAGQITAIGGNLSDSVGQKTLRVDARGHVTDPYYFAVLRVE